MSIDKINDVLNSYNLLLNMGYDKHIITDEKIEKVIDRWEKIGLKEDDLVK